MTARVAPRHFEAAGERARKPCVLLRADGSRALGWGHLVRCFALALALEETGADPVFACARVPEALARAIRARFDLVPLPASGSPAAHARRPFALDEEADSSAVVAAGEGRGGLDAVVADHYGIGRVWETRVRRHTSRLMVLDDLADRRHAADLLLDPSIPEDVDRYERLLPSECKRLLGPRFALLRPEFAAMHAAAGVRRQTTPGRVVLFAGGTDPLNATGLVLDAWASLDAGERALDVVIGADHGQRGDLERRCRSLPGVELHVQSDRMAELLARADLLIGAAGGVSWERCCMGVPALMFAAAENQERNMAQLAARRTGIALGRIGALDARDLAALIARVLSRPRLLQRMGRRGFDLVDGLGATRAALVLGADRLALRVAGAQDDELVWPWRNHPATRRFSRNGAPLERGAHREWWRESLADPRRRLFIAHCGNRPVGVLRFDLDGAAAEISIYLDPALTGLGLGPAMLRLAQGWVRRSGQPLRRLTAEILPENRASQSAFAAAGFEPGAPRWTWEKEEP